MLGNSGRQVGVGIPEGQRTDVGPPRTLLACVEAKTYAMSWCDEQGRKHNELMHCIGGIWHRAPNGENYASTLRSIKPDTWLAKLLNEKVADSGTTTVPAQDAVDIIGGG